MNFQKGDFIMRNEERAAMRAEATEQIEESENVLSLPESREHNFKFGSIFTGDKLKKGFKKFGVRNLVIVLSVLLIGAAVYVNWAIFGKQKPDDKNNDKTTQGEVTNNDGENQSYFAATQIERQRARDEAMEVLQGVVDDAKTLDAAKEQALSDIAAIAATIEKEANIESLIKAKGFEECVAVINGDKANIIVKSEGLQPNQLSQILEIVYKQAEILPANVTIAEK